MRAGRAKIIWGYLVEVLLAGLICLGGWLFVDVDALVNFVHKTANCWMTLVGAMLALNGTLFVLFIQSLTTDFGGWLKWRGGDGAYKAAYIWVLLIDLVAFVGLIVVGYRKDGILCALTIGWLVYAAINEVTFLKNVMAVVGLNQEFQQACKQAAMVEDAIPAGAAHVDEGKPSKEL
jgi:hypothetical protein